MKPEFRFIPVIGDTSKARVKVVTLSGVSTAHESRDTDGGKMYAHVGKSGSTYTLDIYSDFAMQSADRVASGSTELLQQYFTLDEQNDSGITGRGYLDAYEAPVDLILIVSLAVDADVASDADALQNYPGYDADEYGLASIHADAMRQILTSSLPAAAPSLYAASPISPFVPFGAGVELPDLLKVANPDALRRAAADLAKALSWQQAEHTDEGAALAAAARARFASEMADVKAANTPAEESATTIENNSIKIGSFTRA